MLTDSERDTILLAAKNLTGQRRRRFQAEMAHKHCQGSARLAEIMFGWGRAAVHTGLGELRTGIRCIDNFSARGRRKTEVRQPELVAEIRELVEPHAQADPKFQTTFAYTRITAKAVHEQLVANAAANAKSSEQPVPCERTVLNLLNRMGYRLRRVRKTKPQKNS